MERGSFNGLPVWISLVENTVGERVEIKEAPGVDGAIVEPLGQMPQRYRCEISLIRDGKWIVDDYETATLELRAMLMTGGPYTVAMPSLGELTDLWLTDAPTIKFFDAQRRLISDVSMAFTEAQSQIILAESAISNVETAISALSRAVAQDFANRIPTTGTFDQAVDVIQAGAQWMVDTQGKIGAAFQPVNDFTASISTIANRTEQLLTTPLDLASFLMTTAGGLMSLIPALSRQGDQDLGSAAVQDAGSDKPAALFIDVLGSGETFDSVVPTPQGEVVPDPSEEDLAEIDEAAAAKTLVLTAIVIGSGLAITATSFATINSVIAVADALDPVFEVLFEQQGLHHEVYTQARNLRASTLQFLGETAASLPRLRRFTTTHDTDVLDVLVDLYDTLDGEDAVEAAVNSLCALNSIPDPLDITRGTVLRYLDPLV